MDTILVVDDEPNYLVVLSELLKEEGYEVFTAQSGEKGLKIAKENDLDHYNNRHADARHGRPGTLKGGKIL